MFRRLTPGRILFKLVVLVIVVFYVDLSRAPSEQWTARAMLWTIDVYQEVASPRIGAIGVRCRFEPSCSHYGEAVIARYGALKGAALSARRILRCGPWTAAGTHDPPPGIPPDSEVNQSTGV
jgi:hypothetical protein